MLLSRRGCCPVRAATRQRHSDRHHHKYSKHRNPFADSHSNGFHHSHHYTHPDRNADVHVNRHGISYAFPAANFHVYPVADFDSHANLYTLTNCNGYIHIDLHANIHTYSNIHIN